MWMKKAGCGLQPVFFSIVGIGLFRFQPIDLLWGQPGVFEYFF